MNSPTRAEFNDLKDDVKTMRKDVSSIATNVAKIEGGMSSSIEAAVGNAIIESRKQFAIMQNSCPVKGQMKMSWGVILLIISGLVTIAIKS